MSFVSLCHYEQLRHRVVGTGEYGAKEGDLMGVDRIVIEMNSVILREE